MEGSFTKTSWAGAPCIKSMKSRHQVETKNYLIFNIKCDLFYSFCIYFKKFNKRIVLGGGDFIWNRGVYFLHWEKSWEGSGEKSIVFSKWVFFCQNGKLIFPFWEKNTHFEKNTVFFLKISHDFPQCTWWDCSSWISGWWYKMTKVKGKFAEKYGFFSNCSQKEINPPILTKIFLFWEHLEEKKTSFSQNFLMIFVKFMKKQCLLTE